MLNKDDDTPKSVPTDQLVISIDVATELDTMLLAEQIYRDYQDILKSSVIPVISKEYNLKIREMSVLAYAEKLNGRGSAADIAYSLRQDPATITRSMVTLIGLGFVTTSESFEDGRSRIITLKDKGLEAVERYNSLVASALANATIIDESYLSVDNINSMRGIMSKLALRISNISKNLRSRSRNAR